MATVTYAHHSLIAGNREGVLYGLFATIFLAIIFTLLQGYEYYNAPFTFSDGVYGSTFFMSTGFHGFIPYGPLFYIMLRNYKIRISPLRGINKVEGSADNKEIETLCILET